HLNEDAKVDSNLRRIQAFFSDYQMNYQQIAIILISFIPNKKYRLCIDRTNWKFGSKDINIFALTIYYKGTSIPILFEMLEKRGNSNQQERIGLLERFVQLFGHKCIRSLTADREFIGKEWLQFLVKNKIKFQIRIPKSHYIQIGNEEKRGDELLKIYGKSFLRDIMIQGMVLHLAMDFSKNKNGDDDPLLVLTNDRNSNALKIYRERWSIEVFFQSIKDRGFRLEGTHLKDTDRLAKLFAINCIAFVICLTVGVYADACEKEIPIKNHGYKANSFFRHGLNILREALRPNSIEKKLVELIELVVNFANSIFENIIEKLIKCNILKIIM
ncbi:MAG: IS4 family transposase, partial [Flavobacteriaceae bacterium]|nr:IS4 family transposase [Flavobacteriaceae bacterium]